MMSDTGSAADSDDCGTKAAELGVAIPPECVEGVLANVRILRAHLAIVRAALPAGTGAKAQAAP